MAKSFKLVSSMTTQPQAVVRTWEIQNFLVTDNAPIEVENIAEYLALPIGTNNINFKNPVTVQYHYISSTGKSYIYVKDDSGCAYFPPAC